MLLHNQRATPLTWEAAGSVYSWEPYGSCEVPDQWFAHMREQGFPVDVAPIPPKVKVDHAAEAERQAQIASDVNKLKGKLEDAEARAAAAKKAAEAASTRESTALEKLTVSEAACKTLEQQLRTLKADVAEYEKMLGESATRIEQLEKEIGQRKAEKKAAQQPAAK